MYKQSCTWHRGAIHDGDGQARGIVKQNARDQIGANAFKQEQGRGRCLRPVGDKAEKQTKNEQTNLERIWGEGGAAACYQ